jgi:cell division protein FtsL
MIEIVKEPRPVEEDFDYIPRNVKQIGTLQGDAVIYVEDYVYRFLHSDTRKKERQVFVFLGEIRQKGEKKKVFIRGALELEDISFGGFMPVFSDDMWDNIYRLTKEYFPGQSIVGWAMQSIGDPAKEEADLAKISKRHFPEEHGNVLLYDAYGDWEHMYMPCAEGLEAVAGFLVYYEKNAAMSKYLSDYHAKHKQQESEEETYPARFCIHDEARYQEEVRQDVEAMARYRAYVSGQQRQRTGSGSRVAVSIAVVVLLLLAGILMQNYTKLLDMQETVETLSKQKEDTEQQQEDAGTQIIHETISKAATELAKADAAEEAISDGVDLTEEAAAETAATAETSAQTEESAATVAETATNVYLQQGYYIVEKGDKLTDISVKVYGTEEKVSEICAYNNIANMDHICVGDKILLP